MNLEIKNFIGINHVNVVTDKPITLFCGHNGAGKSSIRDAISMAITGDLSRISLKKDIQKLLNDKNQNAEIALNQGEIIITSEGKIVTANEHDTEFAPFILNTAKFSDLDENEKRKFLLKLSGIKLSGAEISKRLTGKGHAEELVKHIAPYLKSGMDAALKESEAKAREVKALWKSVTGGETWGKEKAAVWQPEPLSENADQAEKHALGAQNALDARVIEIGNLRQELGMATELQKQSEEQSKKRVQLEELAGKIKRITDKLAIDKASLAEWEAKVKETQASADGEPVERVEAACPECGAALEIFEGKLRHYYKSENEQDIDAINRLPNELKQLTMFRNAVANDERDLKAAESAKQQLDDMKPIDVPNIDEIKHKIEVCNAEIKNFSADVQKYSLIHASFTGREKTIESAAKYHSEIMAWIALGEELKPDGIMNEIIGDALKPVNNSLLMYANIAEWNPVKITSDMKIIYGETDYGLCSESEQWRANAMISMAISDLSGLGFLCLDRFDVLDMKGREDLLFLLEDLASKGMKMAFIFGTLKQKPTGLSESFHVEWIDGGYSENTNQLDKAA